jgi:hypothetical protein
MRRYVMQQKVQNESYLKREGYNYYVYEHPGTITYFASYEDAKEYADSKELEIRPMED